MKQFTNPNDAGDFAFGEPNAPLGSLYYRFLYRTPETEHGINSLCNKHMQSKDEKTSKAIHSSFIIQSMKQKNQFMNSNCNVRTSSTDPTQIYYQFGLIKYRQNSALIQSLKFQF